LIKNDHAYGAVHGPMLLCGIKVNAHRSEMIRSARRQQVQQRAHGVREAPPSDLSRGRQVSGDETKRSAHKTCRWEWVRASKRVSTRKWGRRRRMRCVKSAFAGWLRIKAIANCVVVLFCWA
jgi:hypothetical protein